MCKSPNISIIIPVYNVENYLADCLNSILTQTFTDYEVLLIDDGSTDRSGDICDQFAQKDIRVKVFHQKNSGVSAARNLGLDKSNGEWIQFVDSDDWLESTMLDNYGLFEREEEHNADIFIQGFYEHDCRGGKNQVYQVFYKENTGLTVLDLLWILEKSPRSSNGFLWHKLFSNRIIQKHRLRFHTQMSFDEDSLFWYRYIQYVQNIKVINKVGYHYRREDRDSLSSRLQSLDFYRHILLTIAPIYKELIKSSDLTLFLDHALFTKVRLWGILLPCRKIRRIQEKIQYLKTLKNGMQVHFKITDKKEGLFSNIIRILFVYNLWYVLCMFVCLTDIVRKARKKIINLLSK